MSHREALLDGVRLGSYWCLVTSIMVVPAAVALGSWLFATLFYLAVMLVCVPGTWAVSRAGGPRLVALTLAWSAGVAVSVGLIAFGVHALTHFEPYCEPSEFVECRRIVGGRDVGEATVAVQRTDHMLDSMLPLIGGIVLLTVMVWVAVTVLRRHRLSPRRPGQPPVGTEGA